MNTITNAFNYLALCFLQISLLFLTGCDPVQPDPENPPDLIVKTFEITGDPVLIEQDFVEIPARIYVFNQGGSLAEAFKVAVEKQITNSPTDGYYPVAFTVEGQSDTWYPHFTRKLLPNQQAVFEGVISVRTLQTSASGVTVALRAVVDSCSSDEFMPDHCRVDESDEENNFTKTLSVTFP